MPSDSTAFFTLHYLFFILSSSLSAEPCSLSLSALSQLKNYTEKKEEKRE
jgi:hypothetical protein